jgi:hypothetical protein
MSAFNPLCFKCIKRIRSCLGILLYIDKYVFFNSEKDPYFVGPEAFTIYGAYWRKHEYKNYKFKNQVKQ